MAYIRMQDANGDTENSRSTQVRRNPRSEVRRMTRADAVELWKISRAALAMRNSAGTSGYAQLTAAILRHGGPFSEAKQASGRQSREQHEREANVGEALF